MVLAMKSGLELAVVSGRKSGATESRMNDLGVKHVLQGFKDKVKMLAPLLEELDVKLEQVAFVGNELIDIGLCKRAGIGIAVADACQELLEVADYVTTQKGGTGAVREVLEAYFKGSGIDPKELLK
jgi:3-deoxy-D-manno-octulosonate 8-phosphate phosphatase (KDO 8-P phosphatase)